MTGYSDLEFINELKVQLARYLRKLELENIFGYEHGYALDDDERVVGLNLNTCAIVDIDALA
ncbi:MAG: hypothetical protein GY757_12085, partial [bacterium]|nr:hypothetical protein [bacterium]